MKHHINDVKLSPLLFKDLFLGFAIGDAFGAGVEFQDRNWIKANVDFTEFINVRHLIDGGGKNDLFTKNYHAWDYTDDTEMTVGMIKALLSGETFTVNLLVKYWTEEYQKGVREKGFGRNGHGSMSWFFEGQQSIESIRSFQQNREYPGNAPPMRAVPLGFVPTDSINQYAIINADATHPHPKARAASILVARATEFILVKNGNAALVIPYCLKHIDGIDEETTALLLKTDQLPAPAYLTEENYTILCGPQPIESPRFLPGIYGLPSDAMLTGGAILYVLKYSKSAFEGLKNAVYLGGDVDTIASVCCGILSGLYGMQSLPQFMLDQVEGRVYLAEIAAAFQKYSTV